MSFGVTPEGYNLKTLEQINAQIEAALSQVIDPATGEALQADLTDPSDIVSQMIAIVAEGIADGMLVDQAAYNQFDPGKATGDALSSLMLINGPPRKAATFSLVSLDFTGDASTHGNLETGTLGLFANFTPVADGEFAISIDGDPQDILALNFTGASDYDDVATIVQAGLQAIGTGGFTAATAVASSPTTPATILITSGTFGDLSSVSVLSSVGGGGTDVSGASFLNGLAGTIIPGVSSTIPTALQVSNNNRSIIWETTAEFTFDDLGIASAIGAESAARGAIVAKAGTLTLLIVPSDVISSVTNPLDAVTGNDQETDNAARRRRDLSTQAPGIGPVGAIDANLKAVSGVTFSRVYNNIELITDPVTGIPPKTIGCVVLGGDDVEIAQVIFVRNALGPQTAGTTTIQFMDKVGTIYDIRFYRAIPILVEVEVDISLAPGTGPFPDDGVDQIKQAIVDYSTGGAAALGITEGFDIVGFPPGQDVLYTRLYTPVNSVAGHIINTLKLNKTGDSPLEADIPIGFDEVADIQIGNIEVVVT